MINNIFRYFDLQSIHRSVVARGNASGQFLPVLPQYIVVTAGVVVEPYLRHYAEKGSWDVDFHTIIGRCVFGIFIGIILLPAVYRSSFDSTKPLMVQLLALFPMGIGWQSLVSSSAKLTLG